MAYGVVRLPGMGHAQGHGAGAVAVMVNDEMQSYAQRRPRPSVSERPKIAVLIPCYNEGGTIRRVVEGFRQAIPTATIYVYDNNSQDSTIAEARDAGAVVRHEGLQGKGYVVRRMFSDVEADIYLLCDGDETYEAAAAGKLVDALTAQNLDMVVGKRLATDPGAAYRRGHQLGNRLLTGMLGLIFGHRFTDVLSGYRAFSRRFVKSFPALSTGFDIEVELTIHALELGLPTAEVDTRYGERPEGSESKLNTYSDGVRILLRIINLFRMEKPLAFFSIVAGVLVIASLALAYPLLLTYLETGLVPRFPTAILSASLMILGFLSLVCGLILDTVTRGRREVRRLHYLSIPLEHGE